MIKKIVLDIIAGNLTYPVIESFFWFNETKLTGTAEVVNTKEFNYTIDDKVLNYTTPQNPYSASYKFENIMTEGTLYYWAANNLTCNITIVLPEDFVWTKFEIRPTNNNNTTRYYCKEIIAHYFDETDTEVYTDIQKRPELTGAQVDNTFKMVFNNPSLYYVKCPFNNITMTLQTKTNYSAGMTKLELFYRGVKLEGAITRGGVQGGKFVLNDGSEIYISANSNYSGYYVDMIFNQDGYGFTGADAAASRPLTLYINWFDDKISIDELKFQISGNMGNENRTVSSYVIDFKNREQDALYKRLTWTNDGKDNLYIHTDSIVINEFYILDNNKRYIYYFNQLEDVTGTEKTFTDVNSITKKVLENLTSPKLISKYPFNIQVKQTYNKWFRLKEKIKVSVLKQLTNIKTVGDFKEGYYSLFFAFLHNNDFLTVKMNPLPFDENDSSFTEYQFLVDNVANSVNQKSIITNLKNYVSNLDDNDELELILFIYNIDKELYPCFIRTFSLILSSYDVYKPDKTLSVRTRKDSINIYSTTASTYRLNWYEEENAVVLNEPQPVRLIKIYAYAYTSYSCMYGIGFDDYIIQISDMVETGSTFTGNITLTKGDIIITGKATLLNKYDGYGDLSTIFVNNYGGTTFDRAVGTGLTLVLELNEDFLFKYFKISNYYNGSHYNNNIIVNCYNESNDLLVQKLICEDILGNAVNYQELYDVWN